MEFEWDEIKRLQVLADRGLDFRSADLFMDGRAIITIPTPRGAEMRWKTTARIEGQLYTLVWTMRGRATRVITIRRAHDGEERAYRSVYG